MHPLPANRERELPWEIDDFPQSIYLKEQLDAHLPVRKAVLQELLLG
jgi:aspartate carbamoyltransferase catalytic subunit